DVLLVHPQDRAVRPHNTVVTFQDDGPLVAELHHLRVSDTHAELTGRAQAEVFVDLLVGQVLQRRLEYVCRRAAAGRQPPSSPGAAIEGELRLGTGEAELAGCVDVVPGRAVATQHTQSVGDVRLVPGLDRTRRRRLG